MPWVSLSMSAMSDVRQLVDEASQSRSSARADTAEHNATVNSRAPRVRLCIRVMSSSHVDASCTPVTDDDAGGNGSVRQAVEQVVDPELVGFVGVVNRAQASARP